VADSQSIWHAQTEYCSDANISASYCVIPMSTLVRAPYNLAFNSLIEVRATAKNLYGFAL